MYCACGIKKRDGWKCECDWTGWNLCFEMDYHFANLPKNIPIKKPEHNDIYSVRIFKDDGDYYEEKSEFCLIEKNWGESTNQAISHWKIDYSDGWTGFRGVYAWKEQDD